MLACRLVACKLGIWALLACGCGAKGSESIPHAGAGGGSGSSHSSAPVSSGAAASTTAPSTSPSGTADHSLPPPSTTALIPSGTLPSEGTATETQVPDPSGTAVPGETHDPPPGVTTDPPPGQTGDPPGGNTGDPPGGHTGDPPGGNTGDPPRDCVPSELDAVNVIVFQDATPDGADVEGRMYVGHDATLEGYSIASREPDLDCNQFALVVGNDLHASGGSVHAGQVSYGGTLDISAFSAACGISQGSATNPVDFAALEAKLTGYSVAFRNYPVNGVATLTDGTLLLAGTDPVLNVFSVSADQIASNVELSAPETASVIVNVSGTEITWQGKGFKLPDGASCRGGSSAWCHRILFNFYEAEQINLAGIGIQGSILAPYATLDGGGGNVDGQVIVRNLRGGIEYHPYFFTGCLKALP
ncbi:MAG TPA: choice-of-anchor A family protein [Polyangiaceae bacterium]|nr:choice-of-anchor A family protein [Polyangiaceae bacterium]